MNNKLEHLKLIQGVISRMSSSSASIKGWAVALVAALLALAAKDGVLTYLCAAFLPAIALGCLDAYYLHLETGFRKLYDRVAADARALEAAAAQPAPAAEPAPAPPIPQPVAPVAAAQQPVPLFSLSRDEADRGFAAYARTFARPVIWAYYVAILLLLIVLLIIYKDTPHGQGAGKGGQSKAAAARQVA